MLIAHAIITSIFSSIAIVKWQWPERESGEAPITREWIEAVISDEVYSDQGGVCGPWKAADIIFNRIEGELI